MSGKKYECDLCHYGAPESEIRKLSTTQGRFAFVCRSCRHELEEKFESGGPDYSEVDA